MRQTPASSVLLTGSPRSGTTWLAELLETLPAVRRVWEPFLNDADPSSDAFNFGLGWRPFLSANVEHEPLYSFFDRLLHGTKYRYPEWAGPHPHVSAWAFARRVLAPRRTLLKFCRAQRLLPWVRRRFDLPTLLLMRHPLAVVASQLQKPAFQQRGVEDQHPVLSDAVTERWPNLAQYACSLDHYDEKLAATWAFDYMIPLQARPSLRPDLIVTYEQLVTDPDTELQRIEDALDISFDVSVQKRLRQPSATTADDSNVLRGHDRLSTWKHRLSDEQVDRVLAVTERFGLAFYTSDGYFDRSSFADLYETDTRA
jgi:hypothetical protein